MLGLGLGLRVTVMGKSEGLGLTMLFADLASFRDHLHRRPTPANEQTKAKEQILAER